jgi:hypothetical protein
MVWSTLQYYKDTPDGGMAGDILSFRAFGQVIVVLNSMKVNKDLLERRPDIYSDRPVIPIFDMYVFLS